ncbi:uncharacterized protein V2V93DRAFT_359523 [Kockiozyma suomiensis]|uniref:uncharacterized protein n=1 Tax=Kockiozyma suomiensis TaxID=1337062 RepID=UPI003343C789
MSKLKFAVIGCGVIGPRHARLVVANPDAQLVAIVTRSSAGVGLASELGATSYSSVADLIASPDKPDAAIICTPNDTHAPVARELSAAGIHVLIEKPISSDIPSGKSLLEHLDKTGVVAFVGHHRRFNPYILAAKEIVESGKLGDIIALNGLWLMFRSDYYFNDPWEWRRTKVGGVILINMIHEIDCLHFIFGPIVSVHAEKIKSLRGFEAEEGAALTLRFKSGMVGTFLIADNVPSPYNVEGGTGEYLQDPKSGEDFWRIFGTNATLSVPDMKIWSHDGVKSWTTPLKKEIYPVVPVLPFESHFQHFIKAIQGEKTPNCTARAGLASLLVCDAIRTAVENNSTEAVEEYEL